MKTFPLESVARIPPPRKLNWTLVADPPSPTSPSELFPPPVRLPPPANTESDPSVGDTLKTRLDVKPSATYTVPAESTAIPSMGPTWQGLRALGYRRPGP